MKRLLVALVAGFVGTSAALALAQGAPSNPIHDKLAALSETERNERLSVVVLDERCRVTRSFFQGMDKSGNAHWNVACANGKTLVIMINNDARGSTRVLECGVMKAVGGTECFKKF
jgi:NaMN:DMB phosphoribosyltransferase